MEIDEMKNLVKETQKQEIFDRKIQIWVDAKNPKSNVNLNWKKEIRSFSKILTGSAGSQK